MYVPNLEFKLNNAREEIAKLKYENTKLEEKIRLLKLYKGDVENPALKEKFRILEL